MRRLRPRPRPVDRLLRSPQGAATSRPTSLAEELRQFVAAKIGKIARPAAVLFGDDLPKTRSGKIMRRLLKDIAEGHELEATRRPLRDAAVVERPQAEGRTRLGTSTARSASNPRAKARKRSRRGLVGPERVGRRRAWGPAATSRATARISSSTACAVRRVGEELVDPGARSSSFVDVVVDEQRAEQDAGAHVGEACERRAAGAARSTSAAICGSSACRRATRLADGARRRGEPELFLGHAQKFSSDWRADQASRPRRPASRQAKTPARAPSLRRRSRAPTSHATPPAEVRPMTSARPPAHVAVAVLAARRPPTTTGMIAREEVASRGQVREPDDERRARGRTEIPPADPEHPDEDSGGKPEEQGSRRSSFR